MWLTVALAGYFLLAVVSILDKLIVSEERVKPIIVTFYSTAPLLLILVLLPFGVSYHLSFWAWCAAFISGFAFTAALWTMYQGFIKQEVSHSGPLIGAATPVFTLLMGQWLLTEAITGRQLGAVALLVIGSLLISHEQSKRNHGWNTGLLWAVAAGLFFALSNIAAKYVYDQYGFYSGFVWTRATIGLSGLLLVCIPGAFASIFARRKSKSPVPRQHATAIVIVDKMLGVGGAILVQYAIALGSVTLVNALAGAQYVFLIFLAALLSAFFPRLFHEDYRPGELAQESVAIVVIIAGLLLLIV